MSINLKALIEAEEKVADGEWQYIDSCGEDVWVNDEHITTDDDEAFIVLARNEMPKLLDWIERAATAFAALEECGALNHWDEGPHHEGWQSEEMEKSVEIVAQLLAELKEHDQ